ncbi:MAG: cysteine--tRNA ligase, partial [Proteobacteria bacterium]|nr:cysteine--tRNA ligase [Pseudomonadota bacterium]
MALQLYNTLTRRKEALALLEPDHVRMYVCGPTVYDRPHLGNARSVVVYDVLFRLLSQLYPKVTYVRNITDVDDKINARARERGISIGALTQEVTAQFHADMGALNCLHPTVEPRATEHMPQMHRIIQQLLD